MSYFTDFAENALADLVRGQGIALPTSWNIGLGTLADDGSFTEIIGTGYARQPLARALGNWSGTQGAGTTLASNGTSHATSNNIAIDFGIAGSEWGAVNVVGLFDDETGSPSQCWMYAPLGSPSMFVNNTDPVILAAGSIIFTLGLTGGMSDYLSNKLIDLLFRDVAYLWPATMHAALFTAAPSNAGGGTEVNVVEYARQPIASSLSAWSGTQSAGSTSASTGTGGRISNNDAIAFAAGAVTTNWGTLVAEGLYDAASAGNLMFWAALTNPKSVGVGASAPAHAADTLSITFA